MKMLSTVMVLALLVLGLGIPGDDVQAQPSAGNRICTFQSATSSTGNGTDCDVTGYTTLGVTISGTTAANVSFRGSSDGGTTFRGIFCITRPGLAIIGTIASFGNFLCPIEGLTHVRAVIEAAGSSVTVKGMAMMGPNRAATY